MRTKYGGWRRCGIGLLGLGIIGGIVAIIVGIGLGLVVYHVQTWFVTDPKPVMVTNINGLAQSPFEVGSSKP